MLLAPAGCDPRLLEDVCQVCLLAQTGSFPLRASSPPRFCLARAPRPTSVRLGELQDDLTLSV